MAITVVQSGQTAGASNASAITITAAGGGNLVASCFSQSNTNTPTCKVGTTSLTVSATKALFNTSAASVWVAYGIAAGGETAVTWTPGTSATGNGVCFWELAGAANPAALDFTPPVITSNLSAATGATPTVTTTVAGSIVLIGCGGSVSSGTVSAWTGTNVATNISTSAARCFGGSFITGATISSAFTANWATSRVCGMIAIAFQAASSNISLSIPAASATAAANVPAVQLSAPVPAAAASAAANVPGVKVTVSPAAAAATAAANVPGVAVRVSPAAAVASASAPVPGVSLGLAIPAAAATASAPVPTVTISGGSSATVPLRMLMGVGT